MQNKVIVKRVFLISLIAGLAQAQNPLPSFLWQQPYGVAGAGAKNSAFSVQPTTDGGFTFTGSSTGAIWLVKTDASGDTLWTRTYKIGSRGIGYSVQQTSDGSYIVTGITTDIDDYNYVFLLKANATGDTLWTKTFGRGQGFSVVEAAGGGFVIVGETDNIEGRERDIWLIKTDVDGGILWTRTYGSANDDAGHSIIAVDGGYVVTGEVYSVDGNNVWLAKIDDNGNTLWTRTYDNGDSERGFSVVQTMDGGYAVLAGAGEFGTWLIKTDAQGDMLWTKNYEGALDFESEPGSQLVQQSADGGYVFLGFKLTSEFDGNVLLIKTDAGGVEEGRMILGGGGLNLGYSLQKLADDEYIIAGVMIILETSKAFLTRIGTGGIAAEPSITAVADVPQDQGRQVYLTWAPGYPEYYGNVTQYGILLENPEGNWVFLGSVPAVQEAAYIYLADTFVDSTDAGIAWSRFKVTAHTQDVALYYESPVDSGYSMDNIAPAMPASLLAAVTGSDVQLSWSNPVDQDFGYYRVYRGTAAGFDPTGTTALAQVTEPAYTDAGLGATVYYRVSAVDANGNESAYSSEVSAMPEDITAPAAPQSLLAVAGDKQVALTWNRNTEADFLRYRIYGGTAANPTTLVDSTSSITDTTKTLTGLANGTTYYYRVAAVDVSGNQSAYSGEVSATPALLALSDRSGIPAVYAFHENYPNPFNPSTTIRFDLPEATTVTIMVYNMLGREVARLAEGQLSPGYHQIVWNGRRAGGGEAPAGLYIAHMATPMYTKSIKMVLLK